jgi:type IV secretion system protein VirB11
VRLVAHHVGADVHAEAPRVSAELPETGERFGELLWNAPLQRLSAPLENFEKYPVASVEQDGSRRAASSAAIQGRCAITRVSIDRQRTRSLRNPCGDDTME